MDASVSGCRAVLQQRPEKSDTWKPLSFYSHSFSLTQSRYSTFDRELLAIYLANKHFRYFIEGRTFIVFTDHALLCKAIFSRSQNSSPRQQRHLDFIAQFTSDSRYVKGKKNVVADCLSSIIASVFEENGAINSGISRTSGSLTSLFSHVSRDNSGATQRLNDHKAKLLVLCNARLRNH